MSREAIAESIFGQLRRLMLAESLQRENAVVNMLMRKPMILFKTHNDPINWDSKAMARGKRPHRKAYQE